MALPATEVPPPREMIDQPRCFAISMPSRISSTDFGSMTAFGMRRKIDASEEYAARVVMSSRMPVRAIFLNTLGSSLSNFRVFRGA